MKAVILAAGNSERHGNKPLLPISETRICIESSILFAQEAGAHDINIVVKPDKIVEHNLLLRQYTGLKYVIQPEAVGVMDAILRGALSGERHDGVMVLFADNIYDIEEWSNVLGTYAVTRAMSDTAPGVSQLDWYDIRKKQWTQRSAPKKDKQYLAGWLKLKMEDIERNESDSLLEFLNKFKVKNYPKNGEWWDIGTQTAYAGYMEYTYDQAIAPLQSGTSFEEVTP